SDSDDGSSIDDRPRARNGGPYVSGFGLPSITRGESSSDDDSDEPPEIPGSPIAQSNGASGGDFGDATAPVSARRQRNGQDASADLEDEEEYEVKEVEQPRAAEFHVSSSSEDEDGSASGGDDRGAREKVRVHLQMERPALGRPKTAAKDLEKYRDVVPRDFFEQFEATAALTSAERSSSPLANAPVNEDTPSRRLGANLASAGKGTRESSGQRGYKIYVPQEVAELFNLTDAYTPEEIEIGTRLEPLLPEFIPSVGLPFDGIQIPRPDGKEDGAGVEVLREPSTQSNVAELELLMQVSMVNQRKLSNKREVVRSIELASHRPKEIDQWISSVAKVQSSKPLAQVTYKQPMPPLAQLMELWPEEFEEFLAAQGAAIPTLSELDVDLSELSKLVCVLLDIPVYEGRHVQSLHVLFSLYHEVQAYERDAQRQQGLQR
ncbi:hypothetical protein BBJ28_00025904, partial [Nothophytophthora sp. Chile5]